jgi:hypothetical protein
MKKILITLIFTLFLFSCSEEEKIIEEAVKKDFYIETKKIDGF